MKLLARNSDGKTNSFALSPLRFSSTKPSDINDSVTFSADVSNKQPQKHGNISNKTKTDQYLTGVAITI